MKMVFALLLVSTSLFATEVLEFSGEQAALLTGKLQFTRAFSFKDGDAYKVVAENVTCAKNNESFSCHLVIADENGIMKMMAPYNKESKQFYSAMATVGIPYTCRADECSIKVSHIQCFISNVNPGPMSYECSVTL